MVRALPGDVLSWAFKDSPKMRSRGSPTTTTGENDYDGELLVELAGYDHKWQVERQSSLLQET